MPSDAATFNNNRNDEARGLIRMSISPDLRFHLQGINALMKLGKNFKLCLVNTILFDPTSWKIS
jgi:hypothetical protein